MSKLDSAKEELGWLKVVFAVLVVIDASLVWVNRLAYRKIRELENL